MFDSPPRLGFKPEPRRIQLWNLSESLRIWDQKGTLLSEGKSTEYLWGVTWNKKGNRIVTTDFKQGIVLWNEKAKVIKVF